jgi:hypothetical protein
MPVDFTRPINWDSMAWHRNMEDGLPVPPLFKYPPVPVDYIVPPPEIIDLTISSDEEEEDEAEMTVTDDERESVGTSITLGSKDTLL